MNGVVTLVLALSISLSVAAALAVNDGDFSLQRQRELTQLIKHDCGSCHGLTLQGGLGPALTPQALQDRVPGHLARVISEGRNGTAMPPWGELLTTAEVEWIVQQLLAGLPQHE